MKISKELIKGSTAMLVLGVLSGEAMYGYRIIKEIEERSDKTFSMNEGTLYPVLHALEKEKCLESYWEETESARKRKYYRITEKGKKALSEKKAEWTEYATGVEKVLRGAYSHA